MVTVYKVYYSSSLYNNTFFTILLMRSKNERILGYISFKIKFNQDRFKYFYLGETVVEMQISPTFFHVRYYGLYLAQTPLLSNSVLLSSRPIQKNSISVVIPFVYFHQHRMLGFQHSMLKKATV